MKSTIVRLNVLLLLSTVMLTACQTDDLPPIPQQAQTGRIVLSLSEVQLYTESSTRADNTGNIADYIYTLTNTATSEASTITFDNGSAIVPAGTYTLTATSKTAQDAAPWYQGTSDEFLIGIGGTQEVSINLGKPKNVEIVVSFDESFTNLYENYSVTIGTKSLTANGRLYAMPDELGKYTIKGSAKAGSHVSDIPASGITGTINNAEAGTSYPVNITANTITDLLIGFGEGTHNGEFDTKEYRPLN